MIYFLFRVIVSALVISTISCSEPKPECSCTSIPEPFHCPYSIEDVNEVLTYFYTDKTASDVKVKLVLKSQQAIIRNATCTNRLTVCCPLPSPDASAIAQFGRYFAGNQRAIEVMVLEAERLFHLTSVMDPDSVCACEIKERMVTAVNNGGYGIIGCTTNSVEDLNARLGNIQTSICVDRKFVEFFTNYKINNIYFTAESNLRKCKTKYIDAFYAELASVNALVDDCITGSICSQF